MKAYFIALLVVILSAPSLFGAERGWHVVTLPAHNSTNGLYVKSLTVMPKQWVSEGSTDFLALAKIGWIGSEIPTNNPTGFSVISFPLGSHPTTDLLGDIGLSIALTNQIVVSNLVSFTVECDVTRLTLPKGATYSKPDLMKLVVECLQRTFQGIFRFRKRTLVVNIAGDEKGLFLHLSRTYDIETPKPEKANKKIHRTK